MVMTREATQFVGPLTFRTLSGNPVVVDLFSREVSDLPVPHVSLAGKADLILIAPCTANIIGKIAHGIADDALTTIAMVSNSPKIIAPAMNGNMWRNPIVSENVEKLKALKWEFIGPEEGKLACGDEDIGRMAEPEKILERVVGLLGGSQDMKGKQVLVTAGGTREAIDPVRYISNRSSGKMGYFLAEAARKRGADVTLIACPTQIDPPEGVKVIQVESTKEMREAVMSNRKDIIIMAAAVSDYRPRVTFWQKLKKTDDSFSLELSKTADILKELGDKKNGSHLVGFAAETENLIENAREKLENKNLDLIVANDVAAFESDTSKVVIIDRSGNVESLPELSKQEIAHRILDAVLRLQVQ